jgi:RyR domain
MSQCLAVSSGSDTLDGMEPNDSNIILLIAAACHQQNRLYCLMLGDSSQVHWDDAPQWQRDSALEGVRHALQDPRPEASHQRWVDKKTAEGWSYGPIKDPDKKLHPCLVPFGDLSAVQQRKDIIFIEMVQQLGKAAGIAK